MRALVFFANEVATEVPRLPHPNSAKWTAELASYPKTVFGFNNSRLEVAAVPTMRSLLFTIDVSLYAGLVWMLEMILSRYVFSFFTSAICWGPEISRSIVIAPV